MELSEIFAQLNTSLEMIVMIITMLGGFGGLAVTQYRRGLSVDKKLNEINKTADERQDEAITDLTRRLDKIDANLNVLAKMHEKEYIVKKFRNEIKALTYTILGQIAPSDEFSSLCMEAQNKFSGIAQSIIETGFDKIETSKIRLEAITELRTIRSHAVGERHIKYELAQEVKIKVAYPLLQTFLINLEELKSGRHNGNSDKQFIKISKEFITEIILKSWELIRRHDGMV